MEHRDRILSRTAADQYGLFTLQQALDTGLSQRTVEGRVGRGTYSRIDPGVFSLGGTGVGWRQRIMSAVLSMNGLTAASHRTAAYLCGLTTWRADRIEMVTVRHERAIRRSFTVHESLDLSGGDIVRIDGLPTTSPARTVVDLGAVSPAWAVEACLDSGLRQRLFTLDEVCRFVNRVAKRGRRGVGVIRPLLEARLEWQGLTESDLEDLFRRVVASSRVLMPRPQYTLRDELDRFICRADFAYVEQKALIELDSEKYHMDPATFARDRDKQNRAMALGWRVYRFTWRQLVESPDEVLTVLAQITAH